MLGASHPLEAAHDMVVDFRSLVVGVSHQCRGTSQRFDRWLEGVKVFVVVVQIQLRGEFAQEIRRTFAVVWSMVMWWVPY